MDGGSGNATLYCYILKRNARILTEDTEYLLIEIINLVHAFLFCLMSIESQKVLILRANISKIIE
jgi:hypothetical protein